MAQVMSHVSLPGAGLGPASLAAVDGRSSHTGKAGSAGKGIMALPAARRARANNRTRDC